MGTCVSRKLSTKSPMCKGFQPEHLDQSDHILTDDNQRAPSPPPPSSGHSAPPPRAESWKPSNYAKNHDEFNSLDEVTAALAKAGLESSNLIVGIDFTKSNEWTGKVSFGGKSLHRIGDEPNPYEQAISIVGKTLAAFDEDNLIPCFGFGDASTHDQDVFSFYEDTSIKCKGFEEVRSRYRDLAPQLQLAGPTSFAPVIEMAMATVEQSGGQYHVLLIVADGQVTSIVDKQPGQLSPQEEKTIEAILKASKYPLSIVMVGVGDGPWDMMQDFDDNLPHRGFDNFQFVNFTEIMSKNVEASRKQSEFACAALMEIPSQFEATVELGLLGCRTGHCPRRDPLPPPKYSSATARTSSSMSYSRLSSHQTGHGPNRASLLPRQGNRAPPRSASTPSFLQNADTYSHSGTEFSPESSVSPPLTYSRSGPLTSAHDKQLCTDCDNYTTKITFDCGHQACSDCGDDSLDGCPMCLT